MDKGSELQKQPKRTIKIQYANCFKKTNCNSAHKYYDDDTSINYLQPIVNIFYRNHFPFKFIKHKKILCYGIKQKASL